jgi:AraC-like DNA-binding protein
MIKQICLYKDFSPMGIELLSIEASDHYYPLHFHKSYCLGEILSGILEIQFENEVQQYSEGDFFLIPPKKSHSCEIKKGKSAFYQVLSFKQVDDVLKNHCNITILSKFTDYIQKYRTYICLENQKSVSNKDDIIVNSIINYLEQEYSNIVTVASLSELVGLSSSRIQHLFKQKTGVSIGKYLILERIRKSKRFLSEKSLSDIALECGFYDQSHFYRYFKKYTGVTPQNYVKASKDITDDVFCI